MKNFIKREHGYSRRLKMIFDEIGFKNTKTVLMFWHMMVDVHRKGMQSVYGSEPNETFVELAILLTKKDMLRICDNVRDTLVNGNTLSPTTEQLKKLWQHPTRNEINSAIRDLYTSPKPIKYLNRVNKYVKEFHLKTLPKYDKEKFYVDFERYYTHWWREVMIFNIDLRQRSQQNAVRESILSTSSNWFDEKIQADLEAGRAFDHPLGERIIEIMASKKKDKRGQKFG